MGKIWTGIKLILSIIGAAAIGILGLLLGLKLGKGKEEPERAREKERERLEALDPSDLIDDLDNADDVRRAIDDGTRVQPTDPESVDRRKSLGVWFRSGGKRSKATGFQLPGVDRAEHADGGGDAGEGGAGG